MEKVEEDLAHSKSLREKQSREYSRQFDDIKMKHDKQVELSYWEYNYISYLHSSEDETNWPFLLISR